MLQNDFCCDQGLLKREQGFVHWRTFKKEKKNKIHRVEDNKSITTKYTKNAWNPNKNPDRRSDSGYGRVTWKGPLAENEWFSSEVKSVRTTFSLLFSCWSSIRTLCGEGVIVIVCSLWEHWQVPLLHGYSVFCAIRQQQCGHIQTNTN